MLPTLIEALQGKRAVQVSAGDCHSLALAVSGEVYSFGHGACGQLGNGGPGKRLEPLQIASLQQLHGVEVAAGTPQSLGLQEDGNVLALGGESASAEAEGGGGMCFF